MKRLQQKPLRNTMDMRSRAESFVSAWQRNLKVAHTASLTTVHSAQVMAVHEHPSQKAADATFALENVGFEKKQTH